MKKRIPFALLIALPLSLSSCSFLNQVQSGTPIYDANLNVAGRILTYFLNGVNNIPYVPVKDTLKRFYSSYSCYERNGVVTISHNGQTAVINANDDTVTYSDFYKMFGINPDGANALNSGVDASYFNESSVLYEPVGETSTQTVCLQDYSLDIVVENNQVMMPAATFFDLFVPYSQITYNGAAYYQGGTIYDSSYNLTSYGSALKNVPSSYTYDENLRDFAYNELCLDLDFNYGLSELRGYSSFVTILEETGIKSMIYDGDPDTGKWDKAMNKLFNSVLNDDGHTYINYDGSNVFKKSKYATGEITWAETMTAKSKVGATIRQEKEILRVNKPIITSYVAGSETLIINFDTFSSFNTDKNGKYLTDDLETSCSIIKVANDYINENDERISNVIINLSSNGGGQDNAELFLSSWIHGEATQYAYGHHGNIKGVTTYVADVNMDGVYNDEDNIKDKKVYLITSEYSYSNGNVFPGEMKGTDNVTILGQKTGGGSCNTLAFYTVLGNCFHMSSYSRAVNSNWESLETGVEPDKELYSPLDDCDYYTIIHNYIQK